jgi:hypothetical protein
MILQQLTRELSLKALNDDAGSAEVAGGYSSDLLSDVLAKAKPGYVWVTNQKHMNVVAVASLLGLAAVIISGGIEPDPDTVDKAKDENVPLYSTDLSAFEVVGKLWSMGVRYNGG